MHHLWGDVLKTLALQGAGNNVVQLIALGDHSVYECKTRDYPALDANEKGTVGHWFSRRLSSLEVEVRMPITLILWKETRREETPRELCFGLACKS